MKSFLLGMPIGSAIFAMVVSHLPASNPNGDWRVIVANLGLALVFAILYHGLPKKD